MITIIIPEWLVIFFGTLFIINLIFTVIEIIQTRAAHLLNISAHMEMMEHNDMMAEQIEQLKKARLAAATNKNPNHH